MSHRREDAGQLIGSAPGMYYEKVYLILTGLHSVIEPHFAGFLHAFSLSQIVDVYKEVVSKLCQKALYPVEDRVLLFIVTLHQKDQDLVQKQGEYVFRVISYSEHIFSCLSIILVYSLELLSKICLV